MANEYGSYDEPGIITEEVRIILSVTLPKHQLMLVLSGKQTFLRQKPQQTQHGLRNFSCSHSRKAVWATRNKPADDRLIDLLNEGASPLYATAPKSMDVVEENHSDETTTSVTLDNESLSENIDDITVTLDGTVQNVTVVYENASNFSPMKGMSFSTQLMANSNCSKRHRPHSTCRTPITTT